MRTSLSSRLIWIEIADGPSIVVSVNEIGARAIIHGSTMERAPTYAASTGTASPSLNGVRPGTGQASPSQ